MKFDAFASGSRIANYEEGRGEAEERFWRGSTRGKYANQISNNRVGTSVLDSMKLKLSIPEG